MDISKIKIAIDTGELQKAKDMLDKLEGQAKKTDKSVSGLSSSFLDLKGAIAGVSAYQLASNFIKTADAMNLLDSRLKLATKSTEEYLSQQTKLTAIAKGTYTSISDTVTLFTKLNPALTKVGATTEQVNSIVATFQRGLQLGGASAQESSSAILQFSQAMGSGVLRGEEFNSMAEASPKLMEYLAKGLGVAQTELRKMAENGELTASRVGNALLKVKTDIEKDFLTMPVTVGKAMTNLSTDMTLAIRDIDTATGASNSLALAIIDFSKNITNISGGVISFYQDTVRLSKEYNEELKTTETVVKVVGGAIATGLISSTVIGGISALSTGMGALAVSILALEATIPVIGWLSAAVGLLAGVYIYNNDKINKSNQELIDIMSGVGTETEILAKQQELLKKKSDISGNKFMWDSEQTTLVGELNKKLEETNKQLEITRTLKGVYNIIPEVEGSTESIKRLTGAEDEYYKQNKANRDTLASQKKEFKDFSSELQKAIDPVRQVREHYADLRKVLVEGKGNTPQALSNLAKAEAEAIDSVNKKAMKSSEDLKKKQEDIAKAYEDIAKEGMSDYDKKLYEIAIKTKDFILLTGDVATGLDQQTKATTKLNEEEAKKNLEKRNTQIDKDLKSSKDIFDLKEKQLGLMDDENLKNQELSRLYNERQKIEIQALYDKGEISKDVYENSLKYEDELLSKNLLRYSATGQIIESVSSGMKSSMMDFFDYTSSGFGNLKKMALDLGNMIYKAVTQQMVVNPLVNALGSAASSYFATPTPTATGGGTYNGVTSSVIKVESAQGNIFNSPSLSQYSNSVVDKPTMFAFANGGVPNMGIMGEANANNNTSGIEAIIPLTRNKNGDLGINASGLGGNMKIEVINQTSQEVQVTNVSQRQNLEETIISVWINAVNTNKMGVRNMIAGAR